MLFCAGGGGAAALELGGELARVGYIAGSGCGEERLCEAVRAQERLSWEQEARYGVQRGHGEGEGVAPRCAAAN